MNKRIFSFLLCLLLIVCVTASAEINTDSSWPVTNEEGITIDLAICVNGSDGNVEDMFLFKWLTEASGITVNVTGITKDAWEARKNLIMTSGDLADVYWGFDWSTTDLYYYGSEGDFIALNDLIDQYGSNLNVIDDYIGHDKFLGAATAPDGNIYGIPAMTEPASDMLNRTTYGMSINTVMLEAIGAEIPTNLTELYDVLNQLNEAGYNGTISAQYDSEFRSLTLAAYQIITDGDVTNNIALKQTAKDVWEPIYLAMEPEYREWLLTLNKLYTEGLIDQSFFTTDVVTRAAKNQENLPAVIVSTLDQSLGEDPEQFKQYQVFLLNEDDTLEPITYNVNHTAPGAFVITSECEYPAEALALIDRLYAPENMLVTSVGAYVGNEDQYTDLAKELLVGYDVEYNEDGTFSRYIYPDLQAKIDSGEITLTAGEYIAQYGHPSSVYNNYYPTSGLYARVILYNAPARNVGDTNTKAIAWFRTQQQENIPNIAYEFPDIYLTIDENERTQELKSEIEDYLYTMEGRFISGELSIEDNYDSFIEQLTVLGVEEYLSIYVSAYEALVG